MTVPEIYNAYLGASRRAKNLPWRARKDFDNFENTADGILCKKLELFFFPHETRFKIDLLFFRKSFFL